jgi:hypothetical protein
MMNENMDKNMMELNDDALEQVSGGKGGHKFIKMTGSIHVRKGPGLDYAEIKVIKSGKTAKYLGSTKKDVRGVAWYKVSFNNKTGWVSSRYSELIGEDVGDEDVEADDEPEAAATPAPTEAPASQSALNAGLLFSQGDPEDEPENEPEDEPEAAPAPAKGPARTVELSGYYLNNLVETANEIGLISYRQVESEAPFQYYDDSVIIAGNQQVENIVVYGPGYEVYGVSVGMSGNAARACLNAAGLDYVESLNGFTYEHRATGASLFTDPKGHDSCINVWVDEAGTVTEIDWSTYTG